MSPDLKDQVGAQLQVERADHLADGDADLFVDLRSEIADDFFASAGIAADLEEIVGQDIDVARREAAPPAPHRRSSGRHEGLVANELACLRLFAALQLPVPAAEPMSGAPLWPDGAREPRLISAARFDRIEADALPTDDAARRSRSSRRRFASCWTTCWMVSSATSVWKAQC